MFGSQDCSVVKAYTKWVLEHDKEINKEDRTERYGNYVCITRGVFWGGGGKRLVSLPACKLFRALLFLYFHAEKNFAVEFTINTVEKQKNWLPTTKKQNKKKDVSQFGRRRLGSATVIE